LTTTHIPTSGLKEFVANFARKHGVRYVETHGDTLADVITRLTGDVVVTDATEDLIVALKRAGVIDGQAMVTLLGNYLAEKGTQAVAINGNDGL
jgi:hypothetical protein